MSPTPALDRAFRPGARLLAAAAVALACSACGPPLRAAVSLSMKRAKGTPKDAAVMIDEQYIGPLAYVSRRGVRLPVGEHRITVEKVGYFPWDAVVVADRQPVSVKVEMQRVPD